MKKSIIFICIAVLLLSGCGAKKDVDTTSSNTENTVASETSTAYEKISQDKAKDLIDAEEPVIILDVRSYDEHEKGHIENSLCIPEKGIGENSKQQLEMMFPNKEQTILVYGGADGNSKVAAEKLSAMGYVNVKDCGDITNWKYGLVK